LEELTDAFSAAQQDALFKAELQTLLKDFAGRETPLYEAKRLSNELGGARIFLKREDLTTPARTRSITPWASASGQAHGQAAAS
jgi:tryptophan synthase beta subunit